MPNQRFGEKGEVSRKVSDLNNQILQIYKIIGSGSESRGFVKSSVDSLFNFFQSGNEVFKSDAFLYFNKTTSTA